MNVEFASIKTETSGNPGTVALHTLGCKLNYAETSMISERLESQGHAVVDIDNRPDLVVINSCSVTNNADRECRQIVRRVLRSNPDACVVVTGCYAQLKPEEIASIEGVDYVLGSSEKFRLAELVEEIAKLETPLIHVDEIGNADSFGPAFNSEGDGRTRAFLKVQDGCDYNCSFCTIPLARGASRSQPVADVLLQAEQLIARGYREIVLTGVNTGDFGRKSGTSLYELLEQLHEIQGVERLRISSIEPNLLTDDIIRLASESSIMMPHFHIPLQSGSDTILGKMRRRYRSADYQGRISTVLDAMPDAGIGVDVIVGFPGETEAEFEKTFEFLFELPVAYLHVFTYSERDNTPAREYEGRVDVSERRARTALLRSLSDRKRGAFAQRFLGTVRSVLIESGGVIPGTPPPDRIQGYTDNYVRVSIPFRTDAVERQVPIRLTDWNGEMVEGEIAD